MDNELEITWKERTAWFEMGRLPAVWHLSGTPLYLYQWVHNPWRRVTQETKFCTVTPNIGGTSVWTLLHFILFAPRILRWRLDFFKNLCHPGWYTSLRGVAPPEDGTRQCRCRRNPKSRIIWGYVPAFSWKWWGKCLFFRTEVCTQDLLNIKQECYLP